MSRAPSAKTLLGRYRAKRDFHATPEPSGAEKREAAKGLFVVQKHAASHLHYDFRLELDGVLKSWAVAKGPSLDPHDRRLAIEVEDHPIGYGDFEGVIPRGQYGGGTVMLWDRGRWEPQGNAHDGLAKGHLKFRLFGERMKGGWALVRMTGRAANARHPNWLLIKERDGDAREGGKPLIERATTSVASGRSMDDIAAERDRVWRSKESDPPRKAARKRVAGKARLPAFVAPELATRVDRPPAGPEWLHEIKYDGYRLLARIAGGEVKLLTRGGHDWTDRFPDIAAALGRVDCGQALIDGEAVALGETGVSDFGRLQAVIAGEARQLLTFEAFDLLHLDGVDLTQRPLEERKSLLRPLIEGLAPDETILYSDHLEGLGERVLAHACQMALEGVVSKRKRSPYRSGRGDDWVKSKCVERQEFVIGGYAKSDVAGKGLRSLLVGYFDRGKLRYAGRVGTGFTERSAAGLKRALDRIKRSTHPFGTQPPESRSGVVWVEPELVCEVEFLAWTTDRILRHASFKGLREDKPAREITIERPAARPRATGAKTRMAANKNTTSSDGALAKVQLTHPERVLDAQSGLTKRGLAEYLALIADRMMPHVTNRPISFVRCPGGTGKACFYQKHSETALPPGIGSVRIREKGGEDDYLTIDTVEGLIGLAQMGVLEIHPWGARIDDIERPDRLIFDFDPDAALPFSHVVEAALEMRKILRSIELDSFVKTTGGKGLHVVAPIRRKHAWPVVKEFARGLATALSGAHEGRYVTTMSKAGRKGKIFIDFFRNDRGATAVAPYSTRARPGALVATPIDWSEVTDRLSPQAFAVETMARRLAKLAHDPWADMGKLDQPISAAALKAMKVAA